MTVVTGVIPSSPNTARTVVNETGKNTQTIVTTVVDMSEVVASSNLCVLQKASRQISSDDTATQPTTISDDLLEDYYELHSQSFRTHQGGNNNSTTNNSNHSSCNSSAASSTTSSTPEAEDSHDDNNNNNNTIHNDVADAAADQELLLQQLQEHKTLKPHGPTPPIIKAYALPQIPVNTKRNAWLHLKAPTTCCVQKRLSRCSTTTTTTTTTQQQLQLQQDAVVLNKSKKRQVTFCAVHIREYEQTIGDNPSVSYGPPVSLDWAYEAQDAMPLDVYEVARLGKRRTLRQMMLNYYHRTHLLGACLGYDETDLVAAQKAAERIKGQRAMTKATLAVSKLEEAWQSTKRKLGKGKKKKGGSE
uniref:Uncharacterized protein n=1 Tax=Amphora coffeiformis TaxID=265554 RepID=A0A7S3P3Z4_9STRA|mmetsp:Transcript_708/g.1383  ORF Transcript_708/g.1383 Transcript_708/m.1383 type:complete len:360 (+) Transcript_708:225-1304(+)|eukprot:scaffold24048_cov194-Amphora_coffeaeformis.AAC.2